MVIINKRIIGEAHILLTFYAFHLAVYRELKLRIVSQDNLILDSLFRSSSRKRRKRKRLPVTRVKTSRAFQNSG